MSLAELLISHFPEKPPKLGPIDNALLARLLPDKPNRVKHIEGVTAFAREVGPRLGDAAFAADLELVALTHDIGYAESLRRTGFHPLDGAILMAHRGAAEAVIHAVLHHSGAREKAKHLPAAAEFYEMFPYQPGLLDEAITFCDTQTSPIGERVTVQERVSEVESRYGIASPVSQVMRRMEPEFLQIFAKVQAKLALS